MKEQQERNEILKTNQEVIVKESTAVAEVVDTTISFTTKILKEQMLTLKNTKIENIKDEAMRANSMSGLAKQILEAEKLNRK